MTEKSYKKYVGSKDFKNFNDKMGYLPLTQDDIKGRIFLLRGRQVILDEDLAQLYGVKTKVLNQAVKRNKERFPDDFMFQLQRYEYKALNLRSQFVTSSSYGGRRYLPYAFTEQGVAMLASLLRSKQAVQISIQIMRAFVTMRRFLVANMNLLNRVNQAELQLACHEKQINKLFKRFKVETQIQGIFFEGQIFDAYLFINRLIKQANKGIRLIDNYIDDSTLALFMHYPHVKIRIYTRITRNSKQSVCKYNQQYRNVELYEFTLAHDRFLIIDDLKLYLIGASLKDLGKKWFGFTMMEFGLQEILSRLKGAKKIL